MSAVTLRAYLAHSYRKPSDLPSLDAEQLADCLAYSARDMSKHEGWIEVGTAQVVVTLRPQADMVADQIASLRAQAQTIKADTQMKLTRIEAEIGKLLAITNEVGA